MNLQDVSDGRAKASKQFEVTGDRVGYDAAMAYWAGVEAGLRSVPEITPETAPSSEPDIIFSPGPDKDNQIITRGAAKLIAEQHLDLSLFAGIKRVTVPVVQNMIADTEVQEKSMSPEPPELGEVVTEPKKWWEKGDREA